MRRHPVSTTLTWIEPGCLAACAYPRQPAALAELRKQGVRLLINLHEQAHAPALLARYGLTEVHLPVPDFTPPQPAQLDVGVAAIEQGIAAGHGVAVHCGGGLGRTGTLLACYLVRRGLAPGAAMARVRHLRPGAIETREQERAVEAYAKRLPAS